MKTRPVSNAQINYLHFGIQHMAQRDIYCHAILAPPCDPQPKNSLTACTVINTNQTYIVEESLVVMCPGHTCELDSL